MKGQIVKIHSDLHYVQALDQIYPCKCRGVFRKEKILPLVGDYVEFDSKKLVIEKILPRKNEFYRPKVSNIDQAFLITSLVSPDFSLNLLDKLIVLMELHSVQPIICITKKDLVKENDFDKTIEVLSYYQKIGYTVIYNTELDKIKDLLKGKTSVFTGQTGAGKSTLLNRLNPDWNLETGEVSIALGRGRHTTRVVTLYELFGGKVMDTPGFSALDFHSYSKEQIRDAFIEFREFPCPFKDCLHTKEAECEVKKAVSANNIMKSRYLNYLNFIGEDDSYEN
jgi:ribosome biogenesis GTPase